MRDWARRGAKLLFSLADLLAARWPGPRILIYHQIEAGLGRQMEVTLPAFRAQLDWLERNGRVVDLQTALARRGESDADSLFVLTFDDGYQDLWKLAFPLLLQRGMPFTLYLTTHPVESGTALDAQGKASPLRWDQVNEMLETGLMTIGAHTHRHPDLRRLGVDVAEELDKANELIVKRTGQFPSHFAYPQGYWSAQADPLVRARYQSAVLGAGPPVTGETDLFRIHRIPIQRSDGLFFFVRKARTGLRMEERVRKILRGYSGPG